MLNKGLDTSFMIEICFQDYKAILSKLHQGEKLVSVLTTGKENYFQVLKLLIAHIPFKDAIHCANEMDTVHKGWIKNLLMPRHLSTLSIFI